MKCDKYLHIVLFAGFLVSKPALATCPNPAEPGGQSVEGAIVYNYDHKVVQFCDGDNWVAMMGQALPDCPEDDTLVMGASGWQCSSGSGGGAPTGCLTIGDQCDDDSYYIGENGTRKVYATTSTYEVSRTWNNGSGNWTTTGVTSTTDGAGNTDDLVNLSDGGAPYEAADYCDGLAAHGHNDWYLPAKDELNLFWNGGSPVAGVLTGSSDWYWSSTENNYDDAWHQQFSDGTQYYGNGKHDTRLVRCVRSDG